MSAKKEAAKVEAADEYLRILTENNTMLKENNQLMKDMKEMLRKIAINTS